MSPGRRAASWLLALGCLCSFGCPRPAPPGDQPMGQYGMSATEGQRSCDLAEVTGADFEFEVVLTRESTSTQAWVTLSGYSREGTFDGQVLRSETEATRVFDGCTGCNTRLVETLTVAVLSRSQIDAANGQCPEDALDGGVAAPNDAGISGPGQTPQGYDAVRLCGVLTTAVHADSAVDGGVCEPACDGCTVRYRLRGERR